MAVPFTVVLVARHSGRDVTALCVVLAESAAEISKAAMLDAEGAYSVACVFEADLRRVDAHVPVDDTYEDAAMGRASMRVFRSAAEFSAALPTIEDDVREASGR